MGNLVIIFWGGLMATIKIKRHRQARSRQIKADTIRQEIVLTLTQLANYDLTQAFFSNEIKNLVANTDHNNICDLIEVFALQFRNHIVYLFAEEGELNALYHLEKLGEELKKIK